MGIRALEIILPEDAEEGPEQDKLKERKRAKVELR
jgi:hypothetical protein